MRLITDGLIGWINLGNDPLGPALGSHPNVEIKFYNPINICRPQGLNARYHEKFFLVDDTWLLMGGRNVSDEFLTGEGDPHYNYDQDVLMYRLDPKTGRGGADARLFHAMWTSALCALRYDDAAALEQGAVRQCREELDALWQTLAATVPLTLPDPETDMVPVEKTLLLTNPTAAQPSAPVVWNRLCQLMDTAEESAVDGHPLPGDGRAHAGPPDRGVRRCARGYENTGEQPGGGQQHHCLGGLYHSPAHGGAPGRAPVGIPGRLVHAYQVRAGGSRLEHHWFL